MDYKIYKDKYLVYEDGSVWSIISSKFLKPWKQNGGYLVVGLGKSEKILLHRLVMKVFIGDSNLTVDHKDGNKLNNNLYNLEYVTQKENNARMKERVSKRILYKDEEFKSGKELAQFLKIDVSYVYRNIREKKPLRGHLAIRKEI